MTKQKIIFYLCAIFLAGGIAGGAIAWTATATAAAEPPKPHGRPDFHKMCDKMRARLQERLELTPAQLQKIDPILQESAKEIQGIQERTLQQVEQVIKRSHAQIALELSDGQKVKLQAYEQERREFWRKRGMHREGSGGFTNQP
jgi:Spy/CpxP family protein refolding chaperone